MENPNTSNDLPGDPNSEIAVVFHGKERIALTKYGPRAIGPRTLEQRNRLGPNGLTEKPRPQSKLIGADLKAWMRSWELSVEEAVQFLNTNAANIEYWCEFSDLRLDFGPGLRLQHMRQRSKEAVMLMFEKPRLDPRWKDEFFGKRHIEVWAITGRQYLREAYTHGLNPIDLEYHRYSTKRGFKIGAVVVHAITRLFGQCEDMPDFYLNRTMAEARLAAKLARWATEPDERVKRQMEQRKTTAYPLYFQRYKLGA